MNEVINENGRVSIKRAEPEIEKLRKALAELQEREKKRDPSWKPKHEVKLEK